MGNFSALLFVLVSYFVPALSPAIRHNRSLLHTCWFTLTFRHFLAFMNAFVTPLSTSWGDLYRFHNIGAGISSESQPYGEFLRVIYKIFGVSFWLGEEASVLTFSFCLILFVELARMLEAERGLGLGILLFGLMPSPAIHCSVTFRESYQVLGFLGSALALFRLRSKITGRDAALFVFSAGIVVFMHHGLVVWVVALFALGLPWALQGRGQGGTLLALVLVVAGPLSLPKLMNALQNDSAASRAYYQGRFLEYAMEYRTHIVEARSDYGLTIETDSIPTFVVTAGLVVAMYFLAPLPWQISSPMDYYAFLEVVVRAALLFGALQLLARSKGEVRQRRLVLLWMALGLELLFSIGTTNWGTSLRHHVVAYGAFVLLGISYFGGITLDPELDGLLRRRERRKRLEKSRKGPA